MLPDVRPLTAFELFLQKRQAAAEGSGTHEIRKLNLSPLSHADLQPKAPLSDAQAHLDVPAPRAPARQLAPTSLQASYNRAHGSGSNRPGSQRNPRRSTPELVPEVVASLPSPRLGAASAQAPAGTAAAPAGACAREAPSAGGGARGRPATGQPATTTAVYGELASAAASLASAAHKLARGSVADRTVAESYETLAQAAADLAASACMIRPLSSAIAQAHLRLPRNSFQTKSQPDPPRSASLPRAVDPMAAAAAAEAAAAAAAAPGPKAGTRAAPAAVPAPGPPARPRPATGVGSVASGGRPRVQAPRFPGYNPLIHFLESELPPPGGTGAARPITSCPITHQLQEGRSLRSATGPSSAASSRLHSCMSGYLGPTPLSTPGYGPGHGYGYGPGCGPGYAPGYGPGPGNRRPARATDLEEAGMMQPMLHSLDLSRLPVLSLEGDGAARPFGGVGGSNGAGFGVPDVWSSDPRVQPGMPDRVAAGAGGPHRASVEVDPAAFLAPYSDVRLAEWPPTEPITVSDMEQEELDMRYNKLLSALRERMHTRGPGRVAAAFRDADRDGIGLVSRRDFMAVLQDLNLGAPGLVDDKVVDLMLSSFQGGARGSAGPRGGAPTVQPAVPYSEFVNAVRFGALPWRGYSRRLRHRMGGDPDQPIGPPLMAAGSLPYGLSYGNDQSPAPPAAAAAAARNGAAGAGGDAAAGGAAGTGSSGVGDPATVGGPGSPLATKFSDLRAAFRQLDHNADGVVEWAEFKEAMRRVGERHRLQLSEQDMMQVYQEADPDFTRGVDYEAFMGMYGSSAPAGAAAAGGTSGPGPGADTDGSGGSGQGGPAQSSPFQAELLQSKQLRCSQTSRPWPWGWGSSWRQQQQQSGPYGSGGGVAGWGAAPRAEPLHGTHVGAAAVLKRLSSTGGARNAAMRA